MTHPPVDHIRTIITRVIGDEYPEIGIDATDIIADASATILARYPEDTTAAPGSLAHKILQALQDAPDGLATNDLTSALGERDNVLDALVNLQTVGYIARISVRHQITERGTAVLQGGGPRIAPTLKVTPGSIRHQILHILAGASHPIGYASIDGLITREKGDLTNVLSEIHTLVDHGYLSVATPSRDPRDHKFVIRDQGRSALA